MKCWPIVEEEFTTLRKILHDRASITRFGDGELKLALGANCKCQMRVAGFEDRMKEILITPVPNLLVGIPRIRDRFDLAVSNPRGYEYWSRICRTKYFQLFHPKVKYYSAFISRTDSAPHIDCGQYWDMCKDLWKDRDLVFLTGEGSCKWRGAPDLFERAKSVQDVRGPGRDAFVAHDKLLAKMRTYPKDHVLCLALGPEATLLAYELAKDGYQALDLGHLGLFYSRKHFKAKQLPKGAK